VEQFLLLVVSLVQHPLVQLNQIEYPKEKDLTKDLETTDKELATAYQSQVLGNYINNIEKKSKIKKDLKFTPKDLDS
jgi:hypothetical protein